TLAQNIVSYRETEGQFASREALNSVPRLGDKAYEQAAGFLRIMAGNNPLDASAVHPESYPLVKKILDDIKQDIKGIIGNTNLLKSLDNTKYVDDKYGLPTIKDILKELEKPGRDPRPAFTTAAFKEGINELKDLHSGMILEGVITNVAAFGAFVDIGVHQDGLVHISALANTFVKDPHSVVKVGQIVKVKVLEIDEKRKRIALTMRLTEASEAKRKPKIDNKPASNKKKTSRTQQPPQPSLNNAMAVALAKLKR
ncbi:MAG: S1 RNA-binding domain-containing protein, partial [Nitrosomonas sp.]|nr:S1 RNA-binding domain-containing protein [Nitrosomonas sp.]